jgi:hypothetical protein
MPSLSGTGGRSSGVNYASAAMYDRMYGFLQSVTNKRRSAGYLAVTYQADIGASGGSLKRAFKGLQLNY